LLSDPFRALVVDDSKTIRRTVKSILGKGGVDCILASNNSDALDIIYNTHDYKRDLDVILTDINRPGGSGFEFISQVRGLDFGLVQAAGLRLRKTPIVVISSCGDYPEYIDRVLAADGDIPIYSKPFTKNELFAGIGSSVGMFRFNLMKNFRNMGYAIIFEGGLFKVKAVGQLKSGTNNEYFDFSISELSEHYSKLMLLPEIPVFAQSAITLFEEMINSKDTKEKDLHEFLKGHPEFLYGSNYEEYWSEPILQLSDRSTMRPDFVFRPRRKSHFSYDWSIVEIKRADSPVLVDHRKQKIFSHHVYRAIEQAKYYKRFFLDSLNNKTITSSFGSKLSNPNVMVLIGKSPERHREEFCFLRSQLGDVHLTTYDEVLEFRKLDIEYDDLRGNRFRS